MNNLEENLGLFEVDDVLIFSQDISVVERMFGIQLTYCKNENGSLIRFSSDESSIYLEQNQLDQRPTELKDCNFSIDVREADIILNAKRKELGANAVVNVTYQGPYCRKISDKTILARGYLVNIIN